MNLRQLMYNGWCCVIQCTENQTHITEYNIALSLSLSLCLCRCGRADRDLRQKRQLLDSQREKVKTLTQQAAGDNNKLVSITII